MADTSRACVDYFYCTTSVSTQRSAGVSPFTYSSLTHLQTPKFHEPNDRLLVGHKFVTAVEKVFTANSQKSAQPSNAIEVNSGSENGNSKAAHMFDEMPNGVLEENSSVTPASPNANGTNSTIIDDMVFEENSHNNNSALQSYYETLQTEVTVDNTIGISSQFVPITSLVVSTGYNLTVNPPLDSKHDDEGNTGNNVAQAISISPLQDKIGYSVAFASEGPFMSNAFWRLVPTEFSFDSPLRLHMFSFFHILLEFCGVYQNRVLLVCDFGLHKCNWVDTGQEHIIPGFLFSDMCAYRNCNVLSLSLGDVTWLGRIMGSRTISLRAVRHSTFVVQNDEADIGELIGKELTISSQGKKIVTTLYLGNHFLENEVAIPPTGRFNNQHKLSQFSCDPGAKFLVVPIPVTTLNLYVWDPGISFEAVALSVYPVNAEVLKLLGCSGKFCLLAYSNSTSRVWNPGQSWCVYSSILQSDSTLGVALSPNFTRFDIVEIGLSFYMKTLSSKVTVLTWRSKFLVFLLARHAENKARYGDMHTLETRLLKITAFASLGMLILWKVDSDLAPLAKYLYNFRLASIMLILAYFHHCKSEGLDIKIIFIPFRLFMTSFVSGSLADIDDSFCAFGTIKPHVSRSAFLVSNQLVFLMGLGGKNYATYSIQVAVMLTLGVGFFSNIVTGNVMLTKHSMDEKLIVPLIGFWTAETLSLFIPWCTTHFPFHEETLSANLIFSTTLRICYMVILHNKFVVLHSLRSWIKQLTVIFNQCSGFENKVEHMWLHVSYGIDVKKYVSLCMGDTLLLFSLLYLNLEDKVLIEGGSIVVNLANSDDAYGLVNWTKAGQAIGPWAKLQRGQRISRPNKRFIWDPG